MAIETFRYFAGAPERPHGETIPVAGGIVVHGPRADRRRRPDHAVELPAGDRLAGRWRPALAAGNTVVLKPAELTPLTALRFARAGARGRAARGRRQRRRRARAATCGARLVEHPDVAKIAFTGSTAVGRSIAAGAAATIKRVTLELGGKSANVVFADADVEAAAQAAPWAVFDNAGQDCCARSRILVAARGRRRLPRAPRRAPSRPSRSATRSTSRPRWGR